MHDADGRVSVVRNTTRSVPSLGQLTRKRVMVVALSVPCTLDSVQEL